MAQIKQTTLDNYEEIKLNDFIEKCKNYRANETDIQEFLVWLSQYFKNKDK